MRRTFFKDFVEGAPTWAMFVSFLKVVPGWDFVPENTPEKESGFYWTTEFPQRLEPPVPNFTHPSIHL